MSKPRRLYDVEAMTTEGADIHLRIWAVDRDHARARVMDQCGGNHTPLSFYRIARVAGVRHVADRQ